MSYTIKMTRVVQTEVTVTGPPSTMQQIDMAQLNRMLHSSQPSQSSQYRGQSQHPIAAIQYGQPGARQIQPGRPQKAPQQRQGNGQSNGPKKQGQQRGPVAQKGAANPAKGGQQGQQRSSGPAARKPGGGGQQQQPGSGGQKAAPKAQSGKR